jgi:hypothetical protein
MYKDAREYIKLKERFGSDDMLGKINTSVNKKIVKKVTLIQSHGMILLKMVQGDFMY